MASSLANFFGEIELKEVLGVEIQIKTLIR